MPYAWDESHATLNSTTRTNPIPGMGKEKKKATTPGEKIPLPVAENRDMRYTRPEYEGLGTKGNMDKDTQGEKENMYYGP